MSVGELSLSINRRVAASSASSSRRLRIDHLPYAPQQKLRNSLAAQVTEVEKGGQLFQRDVENARVAASEALQRHFEAGLYVMREEAKVRVAATKEPVRKVAAIFRAMDEAATARRLRELVETHAGVQNRVFAVMAGPVA